VVRLHAILAVEAVEHARSIFTIKRERQDSALRGYGKLPYYDPV
jgi:hypothetical protein